MPDARTFRTLRTLRALALTLGCCATPLTAYAQDTATPPPAVPEPEPLVGYGESGFFAQSEDGDYRLQLQGQLQPRFDFQREDAPEGEDDETSAVFMVRRARTELSGHIFSPAIKFKFQVDWGRGAPALKDGFIDFVLDRDWISVKLGQLKVPTSRQFLNSSKRLELVDRALATETFRDERDLGFAFHNGSKGLLEYQLGLFNGQSERARFQGTVEVDPDQLEGPVSGGRFTNVPDTFRPLFAARLGVNLGGIDGYSEGDLEGATGKAQGFRFAAAASGFTELDVDEDDQISSGVEGDFIMKIEGFELTAMGFYRHDELADTTEALAGGLAQLSYAIQVGEQVLIQPAGRYSVVAPVEGELGTAHEAGGGMSIYFRGHRLKLQADGYALIDEPGEDGGETTTDALVRAQVQLLF